MTQQFFFSEVGGGYETTYLATRPTSDKQPRQAQTGRSSSHIHIYTRLLRCCIKYESIYDLSLC